jgi:hypothetical protein
MSNLIIVDNNIKYEVYPYDLGYGNEGTIKGLMTWHYAMEACKILNGRKDFHKLGDGWMLPTRKELNLMYRKKENLCILPLHGYWSCDEYDINSAYYQYFFTGVEYVFEKKFTAFARPIRKLQ